MKFAGILETQHLIKEPAPKCCSYCDEEKSFLMIKPNAFTHKGEILINVNHTKNPLWTCLDCFSMELDGLGHSVDIYEYDSEMN